MHHEYKQVGQVSPNRPRCQDLMEQTRSLSLSHTLDETHSHRYDWTNTTKTLTLIVCVYIHVCVCLYVTYLCCYSLFYNICKIVVIVVFKKLYLPVLINEE